MRKFIFIIAIVILGVLAVDLLGTSSSTKNDEAFALSNAQRILNTMTHTGYLGWTSEEYDLYAVAYCEDGKVFVEGKQPQPAGIFLECEYFLAEDIEITISNKASSKQGYFVFKPIAKGGGGD